MKNQLKLTAEEKLRLKIRLIPFSYNRPGNLYRNVIDKDWVELWNHEKTIAWNHAMLKRKLSKRPGGWRHQE